MRKDAKATVADEKIRQETKRAMPDLQFSFPTGLSTMQKRFKCKDCILEQKQTLLPKELTANRSYHYIVREMGNYYSA